MLRMIMKPGRALGATLALGALVATPLLDAPIEAQVNAPRVRVERDDCRCVDPDGKPIENCSCFTFPDVDVIVSNALGGLRGRARLGVTLASSRDEGQELGAVVGSVLEDGPADKAGIREGDIITEVNGTSLLSPMGPDVERELDEDNALPMQRLLALVRTIDPGDDVEVVFLRDGERRTVTLEAEDLDSWTTTLYGGPRVRMMDMSRLGERMRDLGEGMRGMRLESHGPGEFRIWSDSTDSPGRFYFRGPDSQGARTFMFRSGDRDGILRECPSTGSSGWGVRILSGGCIGGLQLVELNPGLSEYFGTDQGVLVADVHEDSTLGVRPGDVILAVGSRDVSDPERLQEILDTYGADEEVTLRVMRQKREMQVQGTLAR